MLRGKVDARTAAAEAVRRLNSKLERRRERNSLPALDQQPARLREEFARVRASDLLAHFRARVGPKFFPGFEHAEPTGRLQRELFPEETARLLNHARRITDEHCWPLLGFGEKCFGAGEINWNHDPLSGFQWPRDYHADINLIRNDGSDARVLWELNRLAHFITLGRAYALTKDCAFSREFFRQLDGWRLANPTARGVNWNCAMEVALRAVNLLAAFHLFLRAPEMDGQALRDLLGLLDRQQQSLSRGPDWITVAWSNAAGTASRG